VSVSYVGDSDQSRVRILKFALAESQSNIIYSYDVELTLPDYHVCRRRLQNEQVLGFASRGEDVERRSRNRGTLNDIPIVCLYPPSPLPVSNGSVRRASYQNFPPHGPGQIHPLPFPLVEHFVVPDFLCDEKPIT